MSRDAASEKLSGTPTGTFIIRFSDGEIGGVSIAWVHAQDGRFTPLFAPLFFQHFSRSTLNLLELAYLMS